MLSTATEQTEILIFLLESTKLHKMSYETWINYIKSSEKTSFISGKLRRIHYKFPDGNEMTEEYNMETGVLIKRAWKKKKDILCMNTDDISSTNFNWEIELGEYIKPLKTDEFLLKESQTEVCVLIHVNLLILISNLQLFFTQNSPFSQNE